jgi:hypothetical protein
MDPLTWPGVFRPLRHHVPHEGDGFDFFGTWVYFALCRSPCLAPTSSTMELSPCSVCLAATRDDDAGT